MRRAASATFRCRTLQRVTAACYRSVVPECGGEERPDNHVPKALHVPWAVAVGAVFAGCFAFLSLPNQLRAGVRAAGPRPDRPGRHGARPPECGGKALNPRCAAVTGRAASNPFAVAARHRAVAGRRSRMPPRGRTTAFRWTPRLRAGGNDARTTGAPAAARAHDRPAMGGGGGFRGRFRLLAVAKSVAGRGSRRRPPAGPARGAATRMRWRPGAFRTPFSGGRCAAARSRITGRHACRNERYGTQVFRRATPCGSRTNSRLWRCRFPRAAWPS